MGYECGQDATWLTLWYLTIVGVSSADVQPIRFSRRTSSRLAVVSATTRPCCLSSRGHAEIRGWSELSAVYQLCDRLYCTRKQPALGFEQRKGDAVLGANAGLSFHRSRHRALWGIDRWSTATTDIPIGGKHVHDHQLDHNFNFNFRIYTLRTSQCCQP